MVITIPIILFVFFFQRRIVAEEELPAFYRKRTTLDVNVYAEDVAEAIAFLASDRSGKSTGNVINVDGGFAAAYPR